MTKIKRAALRLAIPVCALTVACDEPIDASEVVDEVEAAVEAASPGAKALRERPSSLELETTRAYAAEADAVFVGEVSAIEHQISEPEEGGRPLPFTLVTWRVVEGIKGVASGETYSARFLGGPIGDEVIVVDEIPEFDVGDRDLLFVQGNGERGCPLVEGAQGRVQLVAADGELDGLSPSGVASSWVADVTASLRAEGLDRGPSAPRLATSEPFTFHWPAPATRQELRAAHDRALQVTSDHD